MRYNIQTHQRGFVYIDNKPQRYLEPGRHWVFHPFSLVQVRVVDVRRLQAELSAEEAELVPSGQLQLIELGEFERAIVLQRGRPKHWLGEGLHLIWSVHGLKGESRHIESIEVRRYDVRAIEAPILSDSESNLIEGGLYRAVEVPEQAVALRFVDGRLDKVLSAGRHAAWTAAHTGRFAGIDLREKILDVHGQEVMSNDRVSLRLNLSAAYRVVEPEKLARVAEKPDQALYLSLQLSLRREVASRNLDTLLADREAMAEAIMTNVAPRAAEIGLELREVGIKDVILPGDMKVLLNRVIEAEKQAEANVILRRQETAAVRSMANTAKVMADNPLLVRLKELEAYKELAASVGDITVVVGADGKQPFTLMK